MAFVEDHRPQARGPLLPGRLRRRGPPAKGHPRHSGLRGGAVAKIGTPPKEKLKKAGIEAVDTYALEIIEPSAIAHFKDYLEKHERGEVERKPLATPGSLFRGRFFSLGQAARVISVCCQSAAMRVWYKPKTQGQARSRSGGAAVIQRDSPREAVQRAQGRRCVRVPTNGDI